MKKFCFRLAQRASFMAVALLLTAVTARAADDAPPVVPAPSPALAPAPAQDANPPGGRGNRGNNNNNFQRGNVGGGGAGMNFDDKQRELLQESRQTHNDDLRKLNEKLAEAQKEYVKAVVAEKFDEKAVREKADALGKIQADILALNGKSFAVVSPTLKPEQRESLEGNVRIGIVIISPTTGFSGGPGGNFGGGDPNNPGGGRRGGANGGPGAPGIGGGNGGPGGNNADQPRRRGGNGGTAPGQ